jgi:aryl-alcohol dehydrogenase-like predicted oxidoreductase
MNNKLGQEFSGKVILGTVQMGLEYGVNNSSGKISRDESHLILNEAYNTGVRFIDTAEVYGDAHHVIGEFHKKNPGKIFKVITKLPSDNVLNNLNAKVKNYLSELNVSVIETLMFHSFHSYKKNKSVLPELLVLKEQGAFKQLGVSIYTNEELEELISDSFVDVIQVPFNLLDNDSVRGKLLRQAKHENKIVHTRSVFLQGLFFKSIQTFPDHLKELAEPIQNLVLLAKKYTIKMNQLALSYALSKEYIDGVLFGVDSLAHFEENMDLVNLPKELVQAIDMMVVSNKQLLNPSLWNVTR